jgi:hypothetical protein
MLNYKRNMTQSAVYWAPGPKDGFGKITLAAGVIIACRWENKQELFRDAEGKEVLSSAIVYPEMPLAIGGYLYEGTDTTVDPRTAGREVRAVGQSPSLSGNVRLTKVWL